MADSNQPNSGGGVLDPPLLNSGHVIGDRYRLERALGHGGMAAVWLATDERLGRPVAIKLLADTLAGDGEYLQRFRREATLAAGLQHPNLVRVFDFDAGRRPYLVMEYIEGGTLAERIEAGGQPPIERLARELLSALRHIHAAGVVHRDVKPQNVLLDQNDHVRLTDFGIAQPRDATSLTKTGRVLGTESYLAPEVLAGEPASERSDLYALGMVLADAARESATASPVWTLIDRLRDRDPDRRPGSAAIALADLEQAERRAVAGEPTRAIDVMAAPVTESRLREPTPVRAPSEPEPMPAALAPQRRHPRWLAGGALAAVVAALIAVLAIAGGDDDGNPGAERNAAGSESSGNGDGDGDGGQATAAATEPATSSSETSGGGGGGRGGGGDVDGVALNNEGKALIDAGRPEEAIPLLEQAVPALDGSGDQLTYNYALFNLGNALRLAGRPEEAIEYLEERLTYPDQRETVAAELAAAQEAAGIDSGGTPPDGDEPADDGPAPGADRDGEEGPPFGNAYGHDDD